MATPYRPILPAGSDSGSGPDSPTYSSPTMPGKRKRQQVAVACTACQRRKSKCDAARPVCSLCQKKGTECTYEVEAEMSRIEARRRDTEAVSEQNDRLKFVMEYLRFGSDREANEVLRRIRKTENLAETIEFLRQSSMLLQSRLGDSGNRPFQQGATPPDTAGSGEAESGLTQSLESFNEFYEPSTGDQPPPGIFNTSSRGSTWDYDERGNVRVKVPYITVLARPWTSVTDDNDLVSHLLCVFFTWEHPFHSFVDQFAFLRSMKDCPEYAQPSDFVNLNFCSPLLVNAILAKACQCRCDTRDFPSIGDVAALGERFYREASKLLDMESDRASIPAMQAAWIMFTYDSMGGKGVATSRTYSVAHRMYHDLGLGELRERPSNYDTDERTRSNWDALIVIIWGCYIRDSVDSLAGGWLPKIQKPKIERLHTYPDEKHTTLAPRLWFPYPLLKLPVPSIQREMMIALADLSDITHDVLEFALPAPDLSNEHSGLKDAMRIYEKMQAWQKALPEAVKLEFGEVAHVYLLHVQFDAVVICLLRPFQEVEVEISELEQHPRSQCSAYATHAMSILWAYRARWGLARCSSIAQGLMTVAFKLLFHLDNHSLSDKAFEHACQGLLECSEVWDVARLILLTIKAMAEKFDLHLPQSCINHIQRISVTGNDNEKACDMRIPTVIPTKFQGRNRNSRIKHDGAYDGYMADFLEDLKMRESRRNVD